MLRTRWLAILGGVATLGLATPAFAQAYGYDDHGAYHQELDQDHALEHQQLEDEHDQFHQGQAYEHWRLHASGAGCDPLYHWLWHRREARRHRLEHAREWYNHSQWHGQADAEHDTYHQAQGYWYGNQYYYYVQPNTTYAYPPQYVYPRR